MPVLIAVNESYKTQQDLRNLICYAVSNNHCIESVYGAQGLRKSDGNCMYQEMWNVIRFYHKENRRKALHYVVSFDRQREYFIGLKEALEIGYQIAAKLFYGWQVVFGIHTNTENLHIHFVVNNISYENGKCLSVSSYMLRNMHYQVNQIVEEYYISSLPEKEQKEIRAAKLEKMLQV